MIIHYNNMIQINGTSYETNFGDGVTWFFNNHCDKFKKIDRDHIALCYSFKMFFFAIHPVLALCEELP